MGSFNVWVSWKYVWFFCLLFFLDVFFGFGIVCDFCGCFFSELGGRIDFFVYGVIGVIFYGVSWY